MRVWPKLSSMLTAYAVLVFETMIELFFSFILLSISELQVVSYDITFLSFPIFYNYFNTNRTLCQSHCELRFVETRLRIDT